MAQNWCGSGDGRGGGYDAPRGKRKPKEQTARGDSTIAMIKELADDGVDGMHPCGNIGWLECGKNAELFTQAKFKFGL
jgi:hypothetical protein